MAETKFTFKCFLSWVGGALFVAGILGAVVFFSLNVGPVFHDFVCNHHGGILLLALAALLIGVKLMEDNP